MIVSAVIIILFGWIMPKRTYHGVLAREHILGFKEFLSVTEKERLKFHNAPEKNPKMFQEFLPFAIALGVEKQWGAQFKDLFLDPPDWYVGGTYTNFNTAAFSSDITNFCSHAGTSLSTSPSSGGSGGGFSGGGFGGGGGGSW